MVRGATPIPRSRQLTQPGNVGADTTRRRGEPDGTTVSRWATSAFGEVDESVDQRLSRITALRLAVLSAGAGRGLMGAEPTVTPPIR